MNMSENANERKSELNMRMNLKRLEIDACGVAARVTGAHDARSKMPKLPPFSD